MSKESRYPSIDRLINVKLSWWEKRVWYPVCRFFGRVLDIPKEVKWFLQRGFRGYSDRDVWSLDSYLALVIAKSVKQLSKETNGYPGSFKNSREWDDVLIEISTGFELLYNESAGEKFLTADDRILVEEAWDLFQEHFNSLWD